MSNVPYPPPAFPPPVPPPKPGNSALAVILIVMAGLGLVIVIMGILAVFGVRKYLSASKTAEATSTLGHLSHLAMAAYERESGTDGPVKAADAALGQHRICPSASRMVPANLTEVAGKKYMSSAAEWEIDAPSNAGFHCLGFTMAEPQYYQYGYTATKTGFKAIAHGDLDGDGVASTFELQSEIDTASSTLRPSGTIKMEHEDE